MRVIIIVIGIIIILVLVIQLKQKELCENQFERWVVRRCPLCTSPPEYYDPYSGGIVRWNITTTNITNK